MNVKAVGAASVRCMPRVTKYCKTFGVKVQDVPDRICERCYISHTCSPDIPWVFFPHVSTNYVSHMMMYKFSEYVVDPL